MRTVMSVMTIILLHSLRAAGDEVFTTPAVTVGVERVVHVATERMLHVWCARDGDFDACTTFVGYRAEPHCTKDGETWTMRPTATFTPYILLFNGRKLVHEREHIEDVRQSTEHYLGILASLRFESEVDCVQRGLRESALFGHRMREFAIRSNAARHPSLQLVDRLRPIAFQ